MSFDAPTIDDATFRELSEFIRFKSGIVLEKSKQYLIETRLGPLLSELKLNSYSELYRQAKSNPSTLTRVIDEISTNETSWFRDNSPFDLFKYRLIPDMMDRMQGRPDQITVWSAACSTGQEVYSLAMCCDEMLPPEFRNRVRLHGTDISDAALQQASRGIYSDFEMSRGLPLKLRDKYFDREGNNWRVRDELRAGVQFKNFNLMTPFISLGSVDFIFCRNVAIYFDLETRKALFDRFARQIKPGGCLVIGASETLHGVSDRFERHEYMRASYYTPKT